MPSVSPSSPALSWFKSSYSGGNTTECVEVAVAPAGVCIRDSKRTAGPHLEVSAEAWSRFVATSRTTQHVR
ncbi:DUF397 domain-containing protein [Streptomyces sp. NBC_01361]|uniref:DUF397 domain-containing protein n=1 Tax=Streptomyces sp. NBC_01361 TaxID=2903838 RepID=UPI002E32C310|nr:DUF397 domain-containing protein [Streptomyces sp. NBC_01361]